MRRTGCSFWLITFFFPLFLFLYFRFLNGGGLSKFGSDLNELFQFLGKFLEFSVIVKNKFGKL